MISVSGHGVDTVRATFRVLDSVPVFDKGWQTDMLGAGFRKNSQAFIEDGQPVTIESYQYQDQDNSTLRFGLRGGEYLWTEFSAPRLIDSSLINTSLASPQQVEELLEYAGNYASALIPGAPTVELHKLNKLDYAADLAAGDMVAGVISAGSQFKIKGARKTSTHVYPGETATVRSASAAFRTYAKGHELHEKLRPSDREKYADIIRLTKAEGVTRMEFSDRRRGGLAWSCLSEGAVTFSGRLEEGFGGGVVFIGGLARLEAEISSLGLSSQRESSLLKFATRYAVLGEDGIKQRYSKPTFYRTKRMFQEYGLRLDDLCSFEGEIDLRPVIEELRAA